MNKLGKNIMSDKIIKNGSLEVICGPMFSGKSEELMRRLRRASIAKQQVITFKPSIDNRYEIEFVVSHDGTKHKAQALSSPEKIYDLVEQTKAMVIGIDEAQFFSQDIIAIICSLIAHEKRVIIAGLDLDFRGVPFNVMPILMAIADSVTKLRAICTQCGNDAHFTQRLVNGNPAHYDDPIILIGAQESYQARCRNCYSIDKQPQWR